jgi:hypothetical protein
MNKRGRGKRGGRGLVARVPPPESAGDGVPEECPVVLSITPAGVTVPGRVDAGSNRW